MEHRSNHGESDRESYLHWQEFAITQLGYTINLMMTLSGAVLAFVVKEKLDDKIKASGCRIVTGYGKRVSQPGGYAMRQTFTHGWLRSAKSRSEPRRRRNSLSKSSDDDATNAKEEGCSTPCSSWPNRVANGADYPSVSALAHRLHPHESLVQERRAGSRLRAVAARANRAHQD